MMLCWDSYRRALCRSRATMPGLLKTQRGTRSLAWHLSQDGIGDSAWRCPYVPEGASDMPCRAWGKLADQNRANACQCLLLGDG